MAKEENPIDIYDTKYDEMVGFLYDFYDQVPENLKPEMRRRDNMLLFIALRDVFHLLDLMELDDRRKLEFHSLTPKGEIQIEAAEKTMGRIRRQLLYQMHALEEEIDDGSK